MLKHSQPVYPQVLASGEISAVSSSVGSAIASLESIDTSALDENTAALINSALGQLYSSADNASAAQGELSNIEAQSQVSVTAETNGDDIKATLNALASGLYDTAGKVTSAGEYSVSTLEGETDKLISGASSVADGASSAASGASTLSTGASNLNSGLAQLKEAGNSQLVTGAAQLKKGGTQVRESLTQ